MQRPVGLLFEMKPLGELFVKPKRPQNDSDDVQLTLWENFFGQQCFKYYYTDPFGKLHANDSLNEHINVDSIRIHLNR